MDEKKIPNILFNRIVIDVETDWKVTARYILFTMENVKNHYVYESNIKGFRIW